MHAEARRSRRGRHTVPVLALADTRLSTWSERDRAHVELIDAKNDATIVEWWDEAVREAIEDGFLNPRKLHESAYDYAVHIGLIQRPGAQPPLKMPTPRSGGYWNVEVWFATSASPRIVMHNLTYEQARKEAHSYSDAKRVRIINAQNELDSEVVKPGGVRENPVEARDHDSIPNAIKAAHEKFHAKMIADGKDGLPVVYTPNYGSEQEHFKREPYDLYWSRKDKKPHHWEARQLFKKGDWYHWPLTGKSLNTLPKGARSLTATDWGGHIREAAQECACAHCSAQENPVDVDEHGIPWLKVERDPKQQVEMLEIQNRVGPITGARSVYDLLEPWASRQNQENLVVVLLDIHSELRGVALVHKGSRDRVAVDPQDVLKPAIDEGAKAIVIVHNHPSGHADHSPADASLTKSMREACKAAGIKFVDHVVYGTNEYYSFADKKLTRVRKK